MYEDVYVCAQHLEYELLKTQMILISSIGDWKTSVINFESCKEF